MVTTLSAAQARRVALAAQGFGQPRPATVGTRQLNLAIERLLLLQLDSVNVFERSHYLPLFARLGAYDKAQLDALTFARKGRYIEYWAHQAAVMPVEDLPLFRWRMEAMRQKYAKPGSWFETHPDMVAFLKAELATKGPMAASEFEHEANVRRGPWWGWSDVKEGLEYLFLFGQVVTAGRTRFERSYALPEQIVPAGILATEVSKQDAIRELVLRSVGALGIGTLSDIYDYYRLRNDDTKAALKELVSSEQVIQVAVTGWDRPAFMLPGTRIPRSIETVALLSPFDPVVWERDRGVRMFDFFYRIEIYTPAEKRIHGYYTLPLLIDDELVGRIDLKSDRQNGVLRVQSAWKQEGANPDPLRVAGLLREIADWQGLGPVEVSDRGDFSEELRRAAR